MNIILVSKSPRRRELIKYITPHFLTTVSNIEETYDSSLSPQEIVMYLSRKKAESVCSNYLNDIVIGCDTIVYHSGKVLGKPIDEFEAKTMIQQLSNNTHQVLTGVTIIYNDYIDSFYSQTDVTFYQLTDKEIADYINTKEPLDKAGAYGIQGFGSKFVKEIKGDFYTVVGLPIGKLSQRLKKIPRN